MSKSYFERRIFGQDGQSDSTDDQAPNLGSLKSAGAPTPSQPYRFRAGRSEQPAITSRHYERGEVGQGWEASDELRRRLGSGAPQAPEQPQWDAQTAQPAELDQRIADEERMMDQLTGHDGGESPYRLSAPQPAVAPEEPTFGFHTNEEFDDYEQTADAWHEEQTMRAAPVATTATHAEHQGATPEAAVTEPRVASTAGVRVGQRVNLSDQRSGSSVQPNLYVSADDRIGSASQTRAPRRGGNPLAGATANRSQQPKRRPPQQQPGRKPKRAAAGGAAMPPRRPRDRNREERPVFGWFRNGAMALALLFTVGVLMSVSYAGLQRLGNNRQADVPVLLAPDTPIKLTPEEAGLSADVAAGRTFEGDLGVLSDPRGVLEPSDERFANDAQEAPTMTMNFGGQSIIVPQIDSSQPALVTDPMASIIEASETIDPTAGEQALIPTLQAPTTATQPLAEEPLAALAPLANGLRDLPNPRVRGSVPSTYQGLAIPVQANTTTTTTPSLSNAGTETALVSGQRGAGTPTATIDPASGLPTTPQAPSVSGAAVVSPFGIQLASLRTEQQANVLWKRLQDKYPSLLGGLASRVVRFDSGSRGVFYRLQAGPMPTKATALDFCVKLKTAGQECIFVRG